MMVFGRKEERDGRLYADRLIISSSADTWPCIGCSLCPSGIATCCPSCPLAAVMIGRGQPGLDRLPVPWRTDHHATAVLLSYHSGGLAAPANSLCSGRACGSFAVGGRRDADQGAWQVADYLDSAPYGTVLYDHWFSWHWRYAFIDKGVYTSWFATSRRVLAEDLQSSGTTPGDRYLVVPNDDERAACPADTLKRLDLFATPGTAYRCSSWYDSIPAWNHRDRAELMSDRKRTILSAIASAGRCTCWGLIFLFFNKMAFSNLILARGDTFLYFYPYWHAAAEALREVRVPFWNPAIFMGAPCWPTARPVFSTRSTGRCGCCWKHPMPPAPAFSCISSLPPWASTWLARRVLRFRDRGHWSLRAIFCPGRLSDGPG